MNHSTGPTRSTTARSFRRMVPALAASLLVAVPVSRAQAAPRAVPFRLFSSCPKLTAALREMTLPQVGPYGITGYQVDRPTGVAPPGPTPVPKSGGKPQPKAKKAASAPPATQAAPPSAASATTAAPAAAPAATAPVSGQPETPTVGRTASDEPTSSATNVQEVGVDEGDSVENDGRYLFSAVHGSLRIIDTTNGEIVARLGTATGNEQLLLDKNRLAVTHEDGSNGYLETIIDLWDVTDRTNPRKLSETHLEGSALAVRSVDSRARIVLQTNFAQRLGFVSPTNGTDADLYAAQKRNQQLVKNANADAWLPRSYVVRADRTQTPVRTAIDCREVGRPADPSGLGFTWVATIDLDRGDAQEGARGAAGVIAGGQIVYASLNNLYVATSPENQFVARGQPVPRQGIATRTDIHLFDLNPSDGASYRATGTVQGRLLNQFSMSDFEGNLRVASTLENAGFGTTTASKVTVLRRTTAKELTAIGEVGGLGRTERIYAVRFVGQLGYVVTFRRTDPLFVIDLRDPRSPRLIGELKIPGYSSYLQPIGPGRLLGIGEDATATGQVTGMQLSLFDVADPANPKQLAKLSVGGRSAAEYDHHAFLYWPSTKNVIVPSITYGPEGVRNGVIVADVSDQAITERGRISHEGTQQIFPPGPLVPAPVPATFPAAAPASATSALTAPAITASPLDVQRNQAAPPTTIPLGRPIYSGDEPISRSLIINTRLVTVSQNAVKSSNLDTLEPNWYLKVLE